MIDRQRRCRQRTMTYRALLLHISIEEGTKLTFLVSSRRGGVLNLIRQHYWTQRMDGSGQLSAKIQVQRLAITALIYSLFVFYQTRDECETTIFSRLSGALASPVSIDREEQRQTGLHFRLITWNTSLKGVYKEWKV